MPDEIDDSAAKGPRESTLEKLLEKHSNDGVALARQLLSENHDLRRKNAALRDKVPADDALVLAADDRKAFDAYKALGTPDDLTKALADLPEARKELHGLKRKESLRSVAEAAGFDPDVLGTLAGELAFEIRDGKDKDGKALKQVFVKDGDAAEQPIDEFARSRWEKFLPALAPDGRSSATTPPRGTPPPANAHRRAAATATANGDLARERTSAQIAADVVGLAF